MITSSSYQHIGIIGAGLLGRLTAWQLSQRGIQVSLFEKDAIEPNVLLRGETKAAAFTAAGMIAPLSEAVVSDNDVYRMGAYAMSRWPSLVDSLNPDTPLFFDSGSLLVAHPQDEFELDQFVNELRFVAPECTTLHHVNAHHIQALEPDLNPQFMRGLLLEGEGHLHNRQLMSLLAKRLSEAGVTLYEMTPAEPDSNTVITATETYRFDLVIDCRGLGAKSRSLPLRGVRGETIHIETTEVKLHRPVRLMHPRYQLYVVPKPDNRFIIGATQIESEDRSPISIQSTLELTSALYTLCPAFSEARIVESDTNLRPAFMDNLPRIQQHGHLITANGLFRHGYLLAPAVSDQIVQLIMNEPAGPFYSTLVRESN